MVGGRGGRGGGDVLEDGEGVGGVEREGGGGLEKSESASVRFSLVGEREAESGGRPYRYHDPRPCSKALGVCLAGYPLVQLGYARWGLGRARAGEGRVDQLLEGGRELRHGRDRLLLCLLDFQVLVDEICSFMSSSQERISQPSLAKEGRHSPRSEVRKQAQQSMFDIRGRRTSCTHPTLDWMWSSHRPLVAEWADEPRRGRCRFHSRCAEKHPLGSSGLSGLEHQFYRPNIYSPGCLTLVSRVQIRKSSVPDYYEARTEPQSGLILTARRHCKDVEIAEGKAEAAVVAWVGFPGCPWLTFRGFGVLTPHWLLVGLRLLWQCASVGCRHPRA